MKVSALKKDGSLHFYFDGELDEHAARITRRQIDAFIDENASAERAVFHLTNITFMDSTGIGFFIGRYKKLAAYSIPASFTDVGSEADKVLSLSGVYTVVPKLSSESRERQSGANQSNAYHINGGRKA